MFNRKDNEYSHTGNLPAAGATVESPVFDISSGVQNCELSVEIGASPALASGKRIEAAVLESDTEDGVFEDAPWAPVIFVTGASGGGAAVSQRIGIASTAKKFVKLEVSIDAGGGDNTGATFTFNAMF